MGIYSIRGCCIQGALYHNRFGWLRSLGNLREGSYSEIEDGVKVIKRTDYNYSEVADAIKDTVAKYSGFTKTQVNKCRKNAEILSEKALWKHFIEYYYDAYDFALRKAEVRVKK